MGSSENLLPAEVLCPFCDAELQLEKKERREKRFDCPECQREIDFREDEISEEEQREPAGGEIGFSQVFVFLKQQSPLRKKIFFTLGCFVVVRIGYQILIPGIDADALSAWLWQGGDFFGTSTLLSRIVIFSLGLAPYIAGSALLLLLSGFVAPLKRLRDGSPEQQFVFDRLIYVMVALVALAQSWGVAVFLESIPPTTEGLALVPDTGAGFRFQVMLSLTAGAMLMTWLADQITQKGIGNGVAMIFLMLIIDDLPSHFLRELSGLMNGTKEIFYELLILALWVLIAAGTTWFISAKRLLTLERIDSDSQTNSQTTLKIPLRVNAFGGIPTRIAAVFLSPFLIYGVITFDSPVYWAVLITLVVFMAYLITAITFSPKKLAAEIEAMAYTITRLQDGEDVKEHIDGIMARTILPGAAFLAALAYLPFLLSGWETANLSPGVLVFFGPTLLSISAVCLDVFEQIRAEVQTYFKNAAANKERFTEWVPIYFGDTVTEIEMIRHELARSGIDAVVFANRVISLTGTLAFWEAARPTYPALTIHRRLGMGGVSVRVHPEDVEKALSICERSVKL
jgi:preprotein translocase subunit SecY